MKQEQREQRVKQEQREQREQQEQQEQRVKQEQREQQVKQEQQEQQVKQEQQEQQEPQVKQEQLEQQEQQVKQEQLGQQVKQGLAKLPYTIEAFDNSNISGSDAVAGCVVFKSMKPSKKDYRKYEIKSVSGPDDYASMQEVVRRRYGKEDAVLPDLIVCDGGKGQMNCVREVVEDELGLSIPIAGLAKDDKHRTNELLYGFPQQTIQLKTNSELFHVLTQLQDEVHRFAITFHREKRSKHALHSELDEIKGIGPSSKEALMREFKSVKRIREASLEQLKEVVGQSKASLIRTYFDTK